MDKQSDTHDANASRDETQIEQFVIFQFLNKVLSIEKDFRIECNRVLLESSAGMILN